MSDNSHPMDEMEKFLTACVTNSIKAARDLLLNGIPINGQDVEGISGLHVAAANGHISLAELLLEEGANIDVANNCGWTPLMHAAQHGQVSMVSLLIRHNASINATNVLGAGALTLAAGGGHHSTVRLLLEAGADIAVGRFHHTFDPMPLTAAATNGHASIILLLLQKGCPVNQAYPTTGTTALMLCAASGHLQAAQALIEHGADPDLKDMCGKTALDIAVACTKMEVAEFLRTKTQVAHSPEQNPTINDMLDAIGKTDLKRINEMLKEYPSSANWTHPIKGTSPLMYAAELGHLDIAALLVHNGADIELQDYSSGWTALMHAVFHGQTSIVRYLVTVGASVDALACNGSTALDIACYNENIDARIRQILTDKAVGQSLPRGPVVMLPTDPEHTKEPLELQPPKGLKGWIGQVTQKLTQLAVKQSGPSTPGMAVPSTIPVTPTLQSISLSPIRPCAIPVLNICFAAAPASSFQTSTLAPVVLQDLLEKKTALSPIMSSAPACHSERVTQKLWEPKHLLHPLMKSNLGQVSQITRITTVHKQSTSTLLKEGTSDLNCSSYPDTSKLSDCQSAPISSSSTTISFCGTLRDLLKELHLERYASNFEENEVNLDAFVTLNQEDIEAIGVETVTSKEVLLEAICFLRKERKIL